MIQYFQANQDGIPELAQPIPGASMGSVRTTFDTGAILVSNNQGKVFRLSWEGKEPAKKYLEAGEYKVRGYRIIKKSQDGKTWHISTMAPVIKSFKVEAGKEILLQISSTIDVNSSLSVNNGTVQLGMEITGENRSGLSIYRDGKRIPIGYEILDSKGKVQATGSMTYG